MRYILNQTVPCCIRPRGLKITGNIVGKVDSTVHQHFLLFPTMFATHLKDKSHRLRRVQLAASITFEFQRVKKYCHFGIVLIYCM